MGRRVAQSFGEDHFQQHRNATERFRFNLSELNVPTQHRTDGQKHCEASLQPQIYRRRACTRACETP
ncbi:hypothetical protein QR680_010897 [Steinernema hermaphroditum]|uniref:Uncharacterized protein n=1 Tax=Steinernema hermaphroditum TaxID=289476 RepID=A0AA39ISY2_9BILA|nr:hypothetical protein QR680_010897 [Steinernema hermaphroditum]